MIEAHKARAHSRVGPSSMYRIIACPGSVRASAHEADKGSSFFALEGTAAHELCEFVMTANVEPEDYLGGIVDLGPAKDEDPEDGNPVSPFKAVKAKSLHNPQPDDKRYWRIDEEMVEGATLYRDTINAYIGELDIVEFETKLDISHLHPDCFGTADALVIKIDERHMIVGDLKYGSGLVVEVDDNVQTWSYGSGALRRFHNYGIEKITFVIVQPRAFHRQGPVRKQTIDVADMLAFEKRMIPILDEAGKPGARFAAGSHCRFCPIAHKCNVLRVHCLKSIGAKFGMTEEICDGDMPVIERMDRKTMGRVYREVQVVEFWIRRFLEHAHEQAVNGNVPEGLKIVAKRAYRKWRNPEEAEALCDILGIDEDEIMTEPEFRSVAQIEKIVGAKTFKKEFEGLFAKQSSGFVLALEEDQREAVKVDTSDAFGAVEDE